MQDKTCNSTTGFVLEQSQTEEFSFVGLFLFAKSTPWKTISGVQFRNEHIDDWKYQKES